jgi:quercetin 2,3-dioxygenase
MLISSSSEGHTARVLRDIARVVRTPPPAPGFIGEGHRAVEVLHGVPLASADPFVLLMDDRLDMPVRRVIGGAHPHAGLETVTLLLDGSVYDPDEGELSAGEAVWMTAGRGVIHSEHVEAEGAVRILQLWIGLPERSRFAPPALQVIRGDAVKTGREPGVAVRLYSGSLGSLRSATRNLVPVTLAELVLEPNARFELAIPARQGGFLYAVAGEFTAGRSATPVANGDVAWLDAAIPESSALSLQAGASGARLVLYAGEPQHEALLQRGPFVADTEASIARFFREYRAGRFPRLSELARAPERLANTTSSER